jgi:hypothetical protein
MFVKSTFAFVFFGVFISLGLHRADAQLGPSGAPLSTAIQPGNPANKPTTTKVVRIYNGAGYFDDALAEKLLPMLAKAFPSAHPDPAQPVPSAPVGAQAKSENQKKVAAAAH